MLKKIKTKPLKSRNFETVANFDLLLFHLFGFKFSPQQCPKFSSGTLCHPI
jgi:hypothetical protein